MSTTQDRLGQFSSAPNACNSNPVPPALAGETPTVGRQLSHEDAAGNLLFHVASAHTGNVNVHIPQPHKARLSKNILTGANGALEGIATDTKFKGGAECGLLVHTLAQFVTNTITTALTFLPKELPGNKPVCIYILCAFNGDVNIHVGSLPSGGKSMDDITRDFLARLDRDNQKSSGHHARQLVDDFVAEVTAHLLGGVAKRPVVSKSPPDEAGLDASASKIKTKDTPSTPHSGPAPTYA